MMSGCDWSKQAKCCFCEYCDIGTMVINYDYLINFIECSKKVVKSLEQLLSVTTDSSKECLEMTIKQICEEINL